MTMARVGPTKVYFSDLTHTGQAIASNTFPLGVSFVASYLKGEIGDAVDVELFKYPEDLSRALGDELPTIACFSNFSWNSKLATAYACAIKEHAPETVIVFGGPNYPTVPHEQKAFLAAHPVVDFHVWLEGEQAFLGLYRALQETGFDARGIKARGDVIPGVHYLDTNGHLVRGELGERLQDLTAVPSPYQTGMMDKFFDGVFIPMLQTNRGCPFSCTFCTEGASYYNKVRWSSYDRVSSDLNYIVDRVDVPDLIVVDSNFGMYKQDLAICEYVASLQRDRGWPRYMHVSAGKNQKERVLKAAELVNGAINLSATVQSIDDLVLENIKRRNIALDGLVELSKSAERLGANSYSEVILCLPGDTRDAHFRSLMAMIDSDVNFLRMYQLMLLPGSEMNSDASRKEHGMVTRYRVLPRCFGVYEVLGKTLPVAEIEEICVAQDSMSVDEYLECRALNLAIEIFYNSGIFRELVELLKRHGLSGSQYILRANAAAQERGTVLGDLFENYLRENRDNLWTERDELEAFVADVATVRMYIDGEYGNNELFKYRSLAFFRYQTDLHELAFGVARAYLREAGVMTAEIGQYLDELKCFSLLRKDRMLETESRAEETFHFDFAGLEAEKYRADPEDYRVPEGQAYAFYHSEDQQDLISAYVRQYGVGVVGLGRILIRSHVNTLYRRAEPTGSVPPSARAAAAALGGSPAE